ncbi:MAG: YigZ family protein [Bacillota bacterium]|nr:YigZ family protein [Bacillota bacterium]MDW7684607.1 YigZ family protein [Bacillota bacterium]
MNDRYDTVRRTVRVKLPVGACRFIASVGRVNSEEEAKAFIEEVSGEFSDATHNAFAYKVGVGDGAVCRQSDAAEPAGTAGAPMLQAIEHAGLTNVAVVGTRYFGGVKLGIGGLVRAYRACAEAGLAEAGKKTEICYEALCVQVPYDEMGAVMRELAVVGGEVDKIDYTADGVNVICRVPLNAAALLKEQIADVTRGKAKVEFGHTKR